MTAYLVDTHVLLWWLDDPGLLSGDAQDAIGKAENRVFFSAAAAWEIAIKKSIGRLDVPTNLPEVLQADSIQVLDVTVHHALAVGDLPLLHHDPFDRMQIAQAILEGLTLITRDDRIKQYKVRWLAA